MAVVPEVFGNPFAGNFMQTRAAGSLSIVIFGATGDLAHRKVIPALFTLYADGFLPRPFHIIGYARRSWSDEEFRNEMAASIRKYARRSPETEEQLSRFLATLSYVPGTFEDEAAFGRLKERLEDCAASRTGDRNAMFYLATPPDAFPQIICNLQKTGMVTDDEQGSSWSRVVIEKPFGRDTASARQLNAIVHDVFRERQVYRIDHYLGKETVQNILVFRLGNSIFEPIWNRGYIDHVQITVAESIGIESRAGYFDEAGIMRDMVQSHILQVFTLIAMEPPAVFDATAIHDEKVKVLKALRPIAPERLSEYVVRGQYAAGSVGGEPVVGYLQEEGIPQGSTTETFVALKCLVDNWRWKDVPFYIRSGKRLPKRVTEVSIVFKTPPHSIFDPEEKDQFDTNILRLRIQPQEGISLTFGAKPPGATVSVAPVRMDFMYASSFSSPTPDAYERLLLDAMTGDSTLFAREDEVELSWQFTDQIIQHWQSAPLESYPAGEWGPQGAHELLRRDNREWLRL